jgi:bacillithiol biosynthesis deacetylase BshB1
LGCAATIAKEISLGKKVGIVDLTRGELGTRGSVEIRRKEAKKAADILKVTVRENMSFRDGFFINDEAHQMEVIKIIRKYQPEIVLCNSVNDRHIDHSKGSELVSNACFLSGLRRIVTEIDGENQMAGIPNRVYHYIQWKNLKPDFVVDVSGFMGVKMEAIRAFSSQFYDPNSQEPSSPISSKNLIESIDYRAQDLGRLIGVEHAEGFNVERLLAVNSFDNLI